MKMPLRLTIAILSAAAALMPLSTRAEDDDLKLLRSYPKLAQKEIPQVLFKAQMPENWSPRKIAFEIHNPFRDRMIAALVIGVSFKGVGEEKPTEYEILVHAQCGPLESASGQKECFTPLETTRSNPTITLKEVYLEPLPPTE